MARTRFTKSALADLAHALATSRERWGEGGRIRYAALIAGAVRFIARDPDGPLTHARDDLGRDVRSLHTRVVRHRQSIRSPAHVIYFRVHLELVVAVRILHERMDPARHLAPARTRPKRR